MNYSLMQAYVDQRLKERDIYATKKKSYYSFPKRSEHCRRVFMWVQRLASNYEHIDREALWTAAIFHDVGYSVSNDNHASHSAFICSKYLKEQGYDQTFIDKVVFLVANHSRKDLLNDDTNLELILLMQADLLDETGALSIIWDAMAEGAEPIQDFVKTFERIKSYTLNTLSKNPMVTEEAKVIWEQKRTLAKEFINQLALDLGIEETFNWKEEV